MTAINGVAASNGRTGSPVDDDIEQAEQQMLAIRVPRGVSVNYKSYLTRLHNSFLDGTDVYPATLHEAYDILQRRDNQSFPSVPDVGGMAFATTGQQRKKGTPKDGVECNNYKHDSNAYLTKVTCYHWKKKGHYSNQCPDRDMSSRVSPIPGATRGFTVPQPQGRDIAKTWLLLDNQSTVDVFVNPDLL
jgi:hypothetical protein